MPLRAAGGQLLIADHARPSADVRRWQISQHSSLWANAGELWRDKLWRGSMFNNTFAEQVVGALLPHASWRRRKRHRGANQQAQTWTAELTLRTSIADAAKGTVHRSAILSIADAAPTQRFGRGTGANALSTLQERGSAGATRGTAQHLAIILSVTDAAFSATGARLTANAASTKCFGRGTVSHALLTLARARLCRRCTREGPTFGHHPLCYRRCVNASALPERGSLLRQLNCFGQAL